MTWRSYTLRKTRRLCYYLKRPVEPSAMNQNPIASLGPGDATRMANEKETPLKLEDLIDLEYQLHLDESADHHALRERDRAVGLALAGKAHGRRALFLAWLEKMRGETDEDFPGKRAVSAIGMVSLLLGLTGLLLGAGTALGVFAYEGDRPVNVVNVLGVFVLLQLLLLVFWILAILPAGWIKWLPGASKARDLLRLLSPGRLLPALLRFLPGAHRQSLKEAYGSLQAFNQSYGKLRFWLLARLSQDFALCFNLGALLVFLYMVAVTDLAFAWSTTLDVEPSRLHQLTNALAAPWSWRFPELAPTLDLVQATRYSRHLGEYISTNGGPPDVADLGRWWSFLWISMMIYGLFPRLLTNYISNARFNRALKNVPLDRAAFQILHERLTEPLAEFHAEEDRSRHPDNANSGGGIGSVPPPGGSYAAVNWGALDLPDDRIQKLLSRRLNCRVEKILKAGGADYEEDERTLTALENAAPDVNAAVLVKAWEAPTRDFTNFLAEIREKLSPRAAIVVVPVDLDSSGDPAEPARDDLEQWEKRLRTLGDPCLRTAALAKE